MDIEVCILMLNKTTNTYLKGQNLFMQGDPSFGLYCIGNGNIKVSIVNSAGKESIVRISSDLGISKKKFSSLSHQSVCERFAVLLLMFKESHGIGDDGETLLKINFPREEMGSLLGMASETLIRCISEFKDEKLIKLYKKFIRILDFEKISNIARDSILVKP